MSNQARQPDGIPVGGQFAPAARAASGVALMAGPEEALAQAVAAGALGRLDAKYDLAFTEYDDRLTDDQLRDYLAAADADRRQDVVGSVEDGFEDQRYERAGELAREALGNAYRDAAEDDLDAMGEDEWLDAHTDEIDSVRERILDRDQSSAWDSLVRTTPDQLVRADLGLELDYSDTEDEPQRTETAKRIAERAGIDYEANREAILEILDNGGNGRLQLIWHASIFELTAAGASRPDRVAIANPHLLLMDTATGSGYEADVVGTVAVDTSNGIILDREKHGWGWDQTAGVVKSAYRPGPGAIEYRFPDAAATPGDA